MRITSIFLRAVGVTLLLAAAATAAITPSTPPVNDGFENYTDGDALADKGADGWGASGAGVAVQTTTVKTGSNAAEIPESTVVSNVVSSGTITNFWTDFHVHGAQYVRTTDKVAVNTNVGVMVYLREGGFLTVYDGNESTWDVCTNDAWGAAVSGVDTAEWVRVSVNQNFETHETAVFLDGRALRTGIRFVNTNRTAYGLFQLEGGHNGDTYLDDVNLMKTVPAGLTQDFDNDGMADAAEVQTYGDVSTYHRPVITVTTVNEGGAITPSGSFDIFPGTSTNFIITASPAFTVTDVLTNDVSVGAFPGTGTRNATYTLASVTADTTVKAEFTYSGNRYVPADYTALEDAADALLADETLYVSDGTYGLTRPVAIRHDGISIVGNAATPGNVVVNAPAGQDRDCIQVRADNVSIQGVRLAGAQNGTPGNDGWVNAGIMVGNDAGYTLMATNAAFGGITNCVFLNNEITNCSYGVYFHDATNCLSRVGDLTGNTTGIYATATTDARTNWWGAADGPSGVGPGTGDAVSSNVLFSPWFANAPHANLGYYVEQGESIQDTLDIMNAGDAIVIESGAYTEDLAISEAVTVFADNVTLQGDIDVDADITLSDGVTASNVTVGSTSTLTVEGASGTLNISNLTIGAGSYVVVSGDGTLVVGGMTLTDVTLDSDWGGSSVIPASLTFEDGFESYSAGVSVEDLGYFGWGSPSDESVVQGITVKAGSRAVEVAPAATVSNAVTAGGVNEVWMECHLNGLSQRPMSGAPDVDSSAAVMLFVNTSGQLVVHNSDSNAWIACEQDAWGDNMTALGSGWYRLTIFHDYTAETVAILIDGRVVCEQLPFVGNPGAFHGMELTAGSEASTYMDGMYVSATVPSDLTDDLDNDGVADTEELLQYGTVTTEPSIGPTGTIFRFK